MLHLTFTGEIDTLKAGIEELAPEMSFTPHFGPASGIEVAVSAGPADKLRVRYADGRAEIVFGRKHHFFRALGLLLERLQAGETAFDIEETVYFTMNGPMYDVSQGNAVINLRAVRYILRRMAVMGLNMLMLYCEDSYDVPGEPYFGYMRSRYSEDDMRALDDYADMFGIEMIPCIQTLAHLENVLRWPAFGEIREYGECLLVGEEKTYDFIRELLIAASRPFRSKRIHIGMDEAMELGRHKYLDRHGLVPRTQIMREHLARVTQITRELRLQPMMWSDMFFRAVNPSGGYYSENVRFDPAFLETVPKDVQMVYWDYYHWDSEDFYRKYIDIHRSFGEPVFAGGIWTWLSFGANYTKTLRTTNPALMACKWKGVREVFATVWGDYGTECSVYATLLGLSLFAEHGYTWELSEEKLRRRFEFCCGAKYDDFMNLRYFDETPGVEKDNLLQKNPSKPLMWQDILTGLFDKNIEGLPMDAHYAKLAGMLSPACERSGECNSMFAFCREAARVLAVKSEMGLRLTAAYKAGDREALRRFAADELPSLAERVKELRRVHMAHWYEIYKPIGWDIIDMRYGALLARIQSAADVVGMYLDGKLDAIQELDEPRLPYNGEEGVATYAGFYNRIVSASRIAVYY